MASSVLQAFERHTEAVRDRDLDAIVAGYTPDAVLADTNRIGRGHDYIRAVHAETLDAAASLEPAMEVLEDGDVVFVAWHAAPAGGPELRGTNTFVFTGDLIAVSTAYLAVAAALPIRLDRTAG